ncbi:uncharacterized protein LOC110269184 [Arachis ipaensis]|uniref:uncharacterized protein LOC110269184 n=1 Tax=Arachis ipaensis TaxID=130454 RepID=UPI000A2B4F18|nr:uncharacterized protein LOC110269184 [Arachis ipaensis]
MNTILYGGASPATAHPPNDDGAFSAALFQRFQLRLRHACNNNYLRQPILHCLIRSTPPHEGHPCLLEAWTGLLQFSCRLQFYKHSQTGVIGIESCFTFGVRRPSCTPQPALKET